MKVLMFWLMTALLLMGQSPALADSNEKVRGYVAAVASNPQLRPGNEPFFLEAHPEKAKLLFMHGFTASPWEAREMAEYLHKGGVSVFVPLLAGHGTSWEDLKDTSRQDWYGTASESFDLLYESLGDAGDNGKGCVFVGGMSTGSALALMLARDHREKVCGIVSIGTPIYFQNWRARFAWLFKMLIPHTTRPLSQEAFPYYYEKRPTAAVAQLYEMVRRLKGMLPHIDQSILILQSLEDETIKPESADYIFSTIGSRDKTMVRFEQGSHVLIKNDRREEVFKIVEDFISETHREGR